MHCQSFHLHLVIRFAYLLLAAFGGELRKLALNVSSDGWRPKG